MQYRLDTIFWAYFDEYLKKEKSFSLRKLTIENKQKINEVYDVTYFAIFQFSLWHSEPITSLETDSYAHFPQYLAENYASLYSLKTNTNISNSKFNLKNLEDVELIKEIATKLVLLHINKTSWTDFKEKYSTSYYWLNSTLYSLAVNFQFDLNFKTDEYIKYHSIAYPFLITCALIDIFDPKNMLKKIKQFFTKSNVAFVFKNGRSLSPDEKKWIIPQLLVLKNEDDWNAFALNFSTENWEAFDINQRFKLIHDLSRITTLFLKENIKNISYIGDGDEVNHLLSNYLKLFLPINDEERHFESSAANGALQPVLFASNTRDYNPKWTFNHASKFREYKKLLFTEKNLCQFTYRFKYVEKYFELIDRNWVTCKIIASQLISFKKTGIVDTLQMFEFDGECYVKKFEHVDFRQINLDTKKFLTMKQVNYDIEDFEDNNSQFIIMLKALTLLIITDYDSPKLFHYSLQEIIKYFIIAFGPYSKNSTIFSTKDVQKIELEVLKLLAEYEKIKAKNKFMDSLNILYKLQNFR